MRNSTRGKVQVVREELERAGEWYDANLDLHMRAARKVKSILEELLYAKRIQFDRVEARVKSRKSYLEKAGKKSGNRSKYANPIEQILDVVGVRVTTYLESTVAEVGALIESEFSVDAKNSLDKGEALGTDRVGYRSRHFVVRLGGKRAQLVECVEFRGVSFEIQVRSMLQHAWAELEHDRRFKYSGELPDDIKRRFSLLAGQLEMVDRAFNEIAREIDARSTRTVRSATGASANVALTFDNVVEFLRGVLAEHISAGFVEPTFGAMRPKGVVGELERFGVSTLGDLAGLVSPSFVAKYPVRVERQTNFLGYLRAAMMITDAERYFEKAWHNGWSRMKWAALDAYRDYGADVGVLLGMMQLRGIDIASDEAG